MNAIVTSTKGITVYPDGDTLVVTKFGDVFSEYNLPVGSEVALVEKQGELYKATHLCMVKRHEKIYRTHRPFQRVILDRIAESGERCIKISKGNSCVAQFLIKCNHNYYDASNIPPE